MDVVGIPKDNQEAVFRAVVAVLHVGNIDFEALDDDQAKVSEKGMESLSIAADLLGVPAEGLEKILTTRTRQTVDGPIISPINLENAVDTRNSFAKTLYSRTFDWLVSCVNKSIGQDQNLHSLIGVLDIYGFEEFAKNDFEQFCINLANEKLQQHFNQHVFKMEQEEYKREGIEWSYIEFIDNQDVLDVIEGSKRGPPGILALLDETCKFPRFTHSDFVQKLESSEFVTKSQRYSKPRISPNEFSIDHYAGSVKYDVTNFLDKNKDFIVAEHQELMSQSTQNFMKILFPPQEKSNNNSSFKFSSVGSRFQRQLAELMASLHSMEPHYIRCIKANRASVPMEFDSGSVLQQLRCGGVLEAVRISCAGYPSKYTYDEFYDHFWMMALEADASLDSKKMSQHIIEKHLPYGDTQFGTTRIFLRAGRMAELDKKRIRLQNSSATKIQTAVRCWIARSNYLAMIRSVLLVQCQARQWFARMRVESIRRNLAALKIQTSYRSFVARKNFLHAVEAVTKIQLSYRAYVARREMTEMKKGAAIVTIQSNWRTYLARAEYVRLLRAVIAAQSAWRAKMARRELVALRIASRESGKLMKDKEALELKVSELYALVEKVKGQRDDLRSKLKDAKSEKARTAEETERLVHQANEKAKASAAAAAAAAVTEAAEREKLIADIESLKAGHQRELNDMSMENTTLKEKYVSLQEEASALKHNLDDIDGKHAQEIERLKAALNKAIAERDAAREEAQFAAANLSMSKEMPMNTTPGHIVGPVMAHNGTGNRTPGTSPQGRLGVGSEAVSDMDRRQKELLAKQQQLFRDQRSTGQERLISALKVNLGFNGGRPIAAIVIFRSCVHWKAVQSERAPIFDKITETIGKEIENHQDENSKSGYWLTTTACLFYLMQKYTKPAGENGITARLKNSGQQAAKGLLAYFGRSPIRIANGDASVRGGSVGIAVQFEAKYPALLFKQQSGALVQKLFHMLRDNVKKEIQGCLNSCINVPKGGHKGSEKVLDPWKQMLHGFDELLNVLKANYVPSLLASKLMEQLFHFINVQVISFALNAKLIPLS